MTQTNNWQYKENFHQTGGDDYDGHYEVTNGDISLCTNDDPEDITETENTLQRVAKALNESGCKFYCNTTAEHALHIENMLLRNALQDIAEMDCDYETVDYGITVHSTECKACKAKEMIKSIKQQTNDTQERIKTDAEAAKNDKSKYHYGEFYLDGYEEGYIAGATAENERAQALVDTLENIRNMKIPMSDQEFRQYVAYAQAYAIEGLQKWKTGKGKEDRQWQPIETAPKDGSTIEVTYDKEGKETCLACWSDNPICMLGPRNGSFPPGWATAVESDCDTNLPLDPPLMWRPY